MSDTSSQKVWKPEVLVLGPGGAKGMVEVGAIMYLEKINMLSDVEIIVGCSIGSVIGLMLICGYTSLEIMIEGSEISIFDNIDLDVEKMKREMGIFSLDILSRRLVNLVCKKMGHELTLHQLYLATGKTLVCTAYNTTKKRTEYLSKDSHPNMGCVKACLLSSAIPVLFGKMEHDGSRYIDGAIGNPYPVGPYDNGKRKILGIYIHTISKDREDLLSYFIDVVHTMIGLDQRREIIIQSSTTSCKHLRLECSVIDTTGASLDINSKAKMVTDGWNVAKRMFPRDGAGEPIMKGSRPYTIDGGSSSEVRGDQILVKISTQTKKAIEDMGIKLDVFEKSNESESNKRAEIPKDTELSQDKTSNT